MTVLDIETTGLDPRRHALLSIGAVNFSDPSKTFYGECVMREDAEIMDEVLELNGFTREKIRKTEGKSASELIKEFVAWLEQFDDQTIAGHNVHSDLGFLRIEALRANLDYKFSYRVVDLHTAAYLKRLTSKNQEVFVMDKTGLEIDDILKFVGITDTRSVFQALDDAKLEAECFSRLVYGKSMFSEFDSFSVPEYLM